MIKFLILIALLGSPSFQTREAVQRSIDQHISLLIPLPDISNEEICGRLQNAEKKYWSQNAEKIVNSLGRLPIIDTHPDTYTYAYYAELGRQKYVNRSPLWLADKEATRLLLLDILKDGRDCRKRLK
jgi:hypothetical protein